MPTEPQPSIQDATLGALISLHPGLARLFTAIGNDPARDHGLTLGGFCARQGLDAATTRFWLEAAVRALEPPPEPQIAGMTLAQLADHIEATHHVYVKRELPGLIEMAGAVAALHGAHDARLREVQTIVLDMGRELLEHLEEEEAGLFPYIRRVEAGTANFVDGRMLDDTIGQMEEEHDATARALEQLRLLTDDFDAGRACCDLHTALLTALAVFAADFQVHVRKENDELFPRTFAHAAL